MATQTEIRQAITDKIIEALESGNLPPWRRPWLQHENAGLPTDWESDVYSWLSEHRCNALENTNDQGGWPDEEDLEEAFVGLGYERVG